MDETGYDIQPFLRAMIQYEAGCPRRIHHFLKVYTFAKMIGEQESLDIHTQSVLEVAAVLHDIGIRPSLEKYQSSAGNYQELEGPPIAEKMLKQMQVQPKDMERICYLIGHHHTYKDIQGLDYQILVEADFLVNIYEDELSAQSAETICKKYFRTKAGMNLLHTLYLQS